jgi:hypothetical protein
MQNWAVLDKITSVTWMAGATDWGAKQSQRMACNTFTWCFHKQKVLYIESIIHNLSDSSILVIRVYYSIGELKNKYGITSLVKTL